MISENAVRVLQARYLSPMLAAARDVRSLKPGKTLIAVPVGSVEACQRLKKEADDCVCLATPEPFAPVGQWYVDFRQVTDTEVRYFLEQGRSLVKIGRGAEPEQKGSPHWQHHRPPSTARNEPSHTDCAKLRRLR